MPVLHPWYLLLPAQTPWPLGSQVRPNPALTSKHVSPQSTLRSIQALRNTFRRTKMFLSSYIVWVTKRGSAQSTRGQISCYCLLALDARHGVWLQTIESIFQVFHMRCRTRGPSESELHNDAWVKETGPKGALREMFLDNPLTQAINHSLPCFLLSWNESNTWGFVLKKDQWRDPS